MEPLKNTIDKIMAGLVTKKNVSIDADPEQWLKKSLTKKELGHIKVKYFKKGILGLSVDSSVWLYALRLKKSELLSRLKKENSQLNDINLRIGEI
jgi:hypothetical protein